MRECGVCGAANSDDVTACASCLSPLTREAAQAEMKKTIEEAEHRQTRKRVFYIAIAVLVCSGLVWSYIRGRQQDAAKEKVRTFYTDFREVDDAHVPTFWKCMLRGGKLPETNIELSEGIDGAIVKSKGGYAKHARGTCIPLLVAAPDKLQPISPPSEIADAYSGYIAAIRTLATDAESYIAEIDSVEQHQRQDKTLEDYATSYHYASDNNTKTYAYDRFLRCAVPKFDGMADMQGVMQYLFEVLKDPLPHAERWRKDCYPLLVESKAARPHPLYAKIIDKFSADDRDTKAFQDCLKKAIDAERQQKHGPFEQAWFKFAKARDDLTGALGAYLGR